MPSEFALIDRYFRRPTRHTKLGIGDDGAIIRPAQGLELVISTDMLVSGTHFLPDANPEDLGWKALAVNVSDMAAMGAQPRWALLAGNFDRSAATVPRCTPLMVTLWGLSKCPTSRSCWAPWYSTTSWRSGYQASTRRGAVLPSFPGSRRRKSKRCCRPSRRGTRRRCCRTRSPPACSAEPGAAPRAALCARARLGSPRRSACTQTGCAERSHRRTRTPRRSTSGRPSTFVCPSGSARGTSGI